MIDDPTAFNCPIDFALDVLGSKWSIAIMRDLCQGKRRTSELRSLAGISPRTLSERLRELEVRGLINRTAYAEIPPRVEYGLTEAGHEVKILIEALDLLGRRWQKHLGGAPETTDLCVHCGRTEIGAACGTLSANK
ncbi:MAG: helix-turn-helix transcriptional regulator [Cyanobacteria bacterium SZAS TMP-1]|nr:helix-turn-helix transcriptional regulator [Cyanobacteria bacterium SZAS TMP-1]